MPRARTAIAATPSSYPLSGMGLVCGVDMDGARCDARISLEELRSRITFTRRKFQGFDIKQGRGVIAVTAKTPLIDGENKDSRGDEQE